jgi:hypothetical protein
MPAPSPATGPAVIAGAAPPPAAPHHRPSSALASPHAPPPPAAAPPVPSPVVIAANPAASAPPEPEPAALEASAPAADSISAERPIGAPDVSILFVAWSRMPAERMVSLRVGMGSLNIVHEGEYVEGLQVSAIHPEAVDFQWTGQKFRVPIRPF